MSGDINRKRGGGKTKIGKSKAMDDIRSEGPPPAKTNGSNRRRSDDNIGSGAGLCTKLVFFVLLSGFGVVSTVIFTEYQPGQLKEAYQMIPPQYRLYIEHGSEVMKQNGRLFYEHSMDSYQKTIRVIREYSKGIKLGDKTLEEILYWDDLESEKNADYKKAEEAALKMKKAMELVEKKKAEEEAEAKRKAEAEAKRKAEVEAKKKAEAEAKQKAEEEAKKKAEAEAKKKAEEEAKIKAEAEAKQKAEAKRKAEEEAKKKAEEESKRKAEAEAKRKAEEEAKKKAEEEAKRKAEAKQKAEEEAKKKAEKETKQKAEEEAMKKAEAEAKKKAEEEAKQKAEEEAKKKAEAEAKKKAEEEAKRKAEEEAKKKAEAEAKKKAEEEAKRNAEEEAMKKAEAEAKKKAEEEAKQKAEEAKKKAEAEAKKKAEEEAKKKAESEAKLKAEEEARKKAEADAKKKAEEEKLRKEAEAKKKAEEEAKKKAEEEKLRKEAEAKKKAEEERQRKESEAKKKAEEEIKRKTEEQKKLEEALRKKAAEAEAKRQEQEVYQKAEETRLKAEREREAREAEMNRKLQEQKNLMDNTSTKEKAEADRKESLNAAKQAGEQAKKQSGPDYSSSSSYLTNAQDLLIKDELDSIDNLRDENPHQSIERYDSILENQNSPRAFYGKALALVQIAQSVKSNKILETAITNFKEVLALGKITPDALYRLAGDETVRRMKFRGWNSQALNVLQMMISRFPEDVKLKQDLGVQYLIVGDNKAGKMIFEKILMTNSDNGFALVHLGFVLKTQSSDTHDLEMGVAYLSRGIATRAEGVLEGNFFFHLGDGLRRLGRESEADLVYREGADLGIFPSFWQRSLYNVDGLKAQPVWTPAETTYEANLAEISKNWKAIRHEALGVLKKFEAEAESLKDTGNWEQFEMYRQGRKIEKNCKLTPLTCSLIDKFPASRTNKRGQVKFSVMVNGTHVHAHTGPTNCRIRAHLPLIVPSTANRDNLKLRVADQILTWTEGKFLIFDDSFDHEVWNYSGEDRIVLVLDMWHPELSAQQRQTLPAI